MYGLQTPESDTDIRGVFLNTDPSNIIGLARDDILKTEGQDFVLLEADFNGRSETFIFDIDFANQLCLEFHLPFLQ